MGSSRTVAGGLVNFLNDVRARGGQAALRALDLGNLAGRGIEDVFVGLMEFICPTGGSVDEGIARDAFVETIADLAGAGVRDLDALTIDQMDTVFELFTSHTIEARLENDIGTGTVTLPSDIHAVRRVQEQLATFVRRAVHDAVARSKASLRALTQDSVRLVVDQVYALAFQLLAAFGQIAAQA